MTEVIGSAATNAANVATAQAKADTAFAEAQKAGLAKGVIDGAKAAQKFRDALGL